MAVPAPSWAVCGLYILLLAGVGYGALLMRW